MCNNNHTPTPQIQADVEIDGTRIGQAFGIEFLGSLGGVGNLPIAGSYLTNVLSAASHTFKLMLRLDSNVGTTTVYASTTIAPITFSVVELYA
jgi:hypothetical protein